MLSEREDDPEFVKALKQEDMSESRCRSIMGALGIEAVDNVNGPILGQAASWDAPVIRPVLRGAITGVLTPFDPYTRIFPSEPPSNIPNSTAPNPLELEVAGSSPIATGTQSQLNKTNIVTTGSVGRVEPMTTGTGDADFVEVSAIPGGIVVGSETLRPGAPPTLTLAKTFSFAEDGNLVIDNRQTMYFAQPINMPSAPVFRIGGQDLTGHL